MLPPLPRCSGWAYSSLISPSRISLPRKATGSACTSSFSRLARRSLALRPAHSRGHQFVTAIRRLQTFRLPPCLLRLLPAGANCRVGLAPTGKRRLVTAHTRSRRSRGTGRRRRCWGSCLAAGPRLTAGVLRVPAGEPADPAGHPALFTHGLRQPRRQIKAPLPVSLDPQPIFSRLTPVHASCVRRSKTSHGRNSWRDSTRQRHRLSWTPKPVRGYATLHRSRCVSGNSYYEPRTAAANGELMCALTARKVTTPAMPAMIDAIVDSLAELA